MNTSGLNALAAMKYPGRGIILGQDPAGTHSVVVYFITGRSAPSQARKLERDGRTIWTKPLDPEILKTGRPDLLVYPAVIMADGTGIAVSNGSHTSDIAGRMAPLLPPREILTLSLSAWDYEPDAPIYTPRISGCLLQDGRAALGIIRRAVDGSSLRDYYDVPSSPGSGMLLATYRGSDRDPILSWQGGPASVQLEHSSASELAEAMYEALAPTDAEPDYRVSCACLLCRRDGPAEIILHIINRFERT